MNQLAGKVASSLSPSAPLQVDFENTSSLDAAGAAAIESAMRAALASHSFHLVSPGAISAKTPARVIFTLSESAANYVWVVRIASDTVGAESAPPAVVAVAKLDNFGSASTSEYISLEKRLAWKQPGEFLDFALLPGSSASAAGLVVLDTNRLAVYKMVASDWQISHTSPIPETALVTRDHLAEIDLRSNSFHMAGRECVGDPDLGGTIHCRLTKASESILLRDKSIGSPNGPGNGVGSSVSETCNGQDIYLASGEGDWTQTDTIQAYVRDGAAGTSNAAQTPSGNPLSFLGPVLSLHADAPANSARAVVHNLKTGEYEAYIVTATCSH